VWTICINILKLLDLCYVILGEEEWEEECGEEPPDGAVSGSTVDDMIPPTAGEECSPVATVTGSSSSPPPSLVRQSNGDIATNNNDKGKKRILTCKILSHYPENEWFVLTGVTYQNLLQCIPVYNTFSCQTLKANTTIWNRLCPSLYKSLTTLRFAFYFPTLSTPCSFYSETATVNNVRTNHIIGQVQCIQAGYFNVYFGTGIQFSLSATLHSVPTKCMSLSQACVLLYLFEFWVTLI
jgi:hypothetical protein